MTSRHFNADVTRAAHVLLHRHGGDAGHVAIMKAHQLLDRGDMDGYTMWTRIVDAVDELFAGRPARAVPLH